MLDCPKTLYPCPLRVFLNLCPTGKSGGELLALVEPVSFRGKYSSWEIAITVGQAMDGLGL
jgi:hypothetical protein